MSILKSLGQVDHKNMVALLPNLKLHSQVLRVLESFSRFERGEDCNGSREVEGAVQR